MAGKALWAWVGLKECQEHAKREVAKVYAEAYEEANARNDEIFDVLMTYTSICYPEAAIIYDYIGQEREEAIEIAWNSAPKRRRVQDSPETEQDSPTMDFRDDGSAKSQKEYTDLDCAYDLAKIDSP